MKDMHYADNKKGEKMNIVTMTLIAIVGVILAVILKSYKPEYSLLIVFALALLFLSWGIVLLKEMKTQLELIESFYKSNQYYYKILFKVIAITYLSEFASSVSKDAGYQSISVQVELMGKLFVLISGMPILLAILETIWNYNI